MAERVEQPTWREVPAAPHREAADAPSTVALVLLVAGPVLRTYRESVGFDRALGVGGALVALHVLHVVLPARAWYLRLAATAAAGAACVPLGGVGVGAWVVLAATVIDWSWRGRPPVPGLPRAHAGSRLPVGATLAAAAGWGWWSGSRIVPLALCAVALVATIVVSLAPTRAASVSERISAAVAAVLGWVVFGLLGLVVVVVPWVGQRLVRHDPLEPGTGASSGWIRRARRSVRAGSPWAVDPRLDDPPASMRWRRRLVAPALGVLAVVAVLAWIELTPPAVGGTRGEGVPVPVAIAEQPEAAEHMEDLDWFFAVAFDPTSSPRIKDVRSRTINVRDGRRASWTPPDCDCRRVSLWFFGGSTAFGMGQRDEHTIASEIARLAWDDGVAVDAENYGVPADMLLHEAQTFAWEMEHRPPPDLVVFFDGINDMAGALHRQDAGCASRKGPPIDPALDRLRQRVLDEIHSRRWDPDGGPAGARVIPSCDGKRVATGEVAEMAIDHYSRALDISRVSADAHGVDAFWFWQPSIYTRARPVEGEPLDEDGGAWSKEWWAAARAQLPEEVVDVAGALDALEEPVFFDSMHHNERGARVIAEEMYRTLRPAIARAAEAAP